MKRILSAFAVLALATGCGGQEDSNLTTTDITEMNATDMNTVADAEVQSDGRSASEPLVFCKPVERTLRVSDCDELTELDRGIFEGGAVLNAPAPMNRGRAYEVTLILDRRPQERIAEIDAADDLANAAQSTGAAQGNMVAPIDNAAVAEPEPPAPRPIPRMTREAPTPMQKAKKLDGKTEKFAPPVSRFMQAELQGKGFSIEPSGPVSKEIPRDGSAVWTWQVTPRQEGNRRLTVTTTVESVIDGRRYALANRDYSQDIRVKVLFFPDRVTDGMTQATAFLTTLQGMLTALTAAIIAGFGLWFAFRNKGKKDSTPPAG